MPVYSEREFARAAAYVLRRLRKKQGLSQERAAELVGMSRQYLTRFEGRGKGKGHILGPYLLVCFAEVYGVPPGDLLNQIVDYATQYAASRKRKEERHLRRPTK